jgi:hypothetical protein
MASLAVGTEDARLPREDFGTSFWQLVTVGYAGSGCVERAVMSLIGPKPPDRVTGRARQLCPGNSDVDLLGDVKCVVDLNAEVAYGAFDPRMTE